MNSESGLGSGGGGTWRAIGFGGGGLCVHAISNKTPSHQALRAAVLIDPRDSRGGDVRQTWRPKSPAQVLIEPIESQPGRLLNPRRSVDLVVRDRQPDQLLWLAGALIEIAIALELAEVVFF